MNLTLFSEELRECLNAAGLSDCGENDEWNYWYQRVLKAHNEAVERQIATEQAENAKLRELVKALDWCTENTDYRSKCDECPLRQSDALEPECEVWMRELGIKEENDEQGV